jgi:hypothetical protein
MAVVPAEARSLVDFTAVMLNFFGFIALYTEVHTKMEKINTTQYIPTQNRNGCKEPMISWRLVLFMDWTFGF